MRIKSALIVIAIAFAITVANFSACMSLVRKDFFNAGGRDISPVVSAFGEDMLSRVEANLISVAIIFFIFSVAAALLASKYIAEPYNRIAEQNRRLEEMNDINHVQAEEIMEVHERTKIMMDATPICSMLWDQNGRIFDCNEEAVKKFGMKSKQSFLDNFYKLSPEYQPDGILTLDKIRKYLAIAFEEGFCCLEWMHHLLDGTPIPCEMTLVRVNYGGNHIVAAYARDLREHKQMIAEMLRLQNELEAALKAAQEANYAKSNFLANMSHEMRTPLNAVIGFSELILNSGEYMDKNLEKLTKVYNSGMTLLGIVNDILDISKIESGKLAINPIEYDTPSLINDIVSLNITRIGEKPLTFRLNVDENLPMSFYGDDLRIKQIFNNLLSNALKYTNSGTVVWDVSFEIEEGGTWLLSNVKDTGIGIKPEDIQKLFKDYTQLNEKTTRNTEGTGLGLAITKRLLDMMGGTISVESEYGKGSTFSVRLRQGFVTEAPIGREIADNLMSDRFFTSKRTKNSNFPRIDLSYAKVLVVDDVPTNLDVVNGMLKPYKVRVDFAINGI